MAGGKTKHAGGGAGKRNDSEPKLLDKKLERIRTRRGGWKKTAVRGQREKAVFFPAEGAV